MAGDVLDASNDPVGSDLRTIEFLSPDSGHIGFNDRGQVAFYARFTDGTSGVFVSGAVAIPEPSAVLAFITCLALAWLTRTWHDVSKTHRF